MKIVGYKRTDGTEVMDFRKLKQEFRRVLSWGTDRFPIKDFITSRLDIEPVYEPPAPAHDSDTQQLRRVLEKQGDLWVLDYVVEAR